MSDKKTVSISSDPEFLDELSEYLEVLSNPIRLKILKFIEREPKETSEIASHIGSSYQNTKKHLDRLVTTSLVKRDAGFGRETDRGIAPVWKYSLADGGLLTLVKTLNIFSSITVPLGYNEIEQRIRSVRAACLDNPAEAGPVLFLIGGPADGRAFILKNNRIALGREDQQSPLAKNDDVIAIPDQYRAVTRVTRPHAFITRWEKTWQIEDAHSTGGTFVNAERLVPGKKSTLSQGDVIDLSPGAHGARFLFISME
ncbi:MAG: FHA domain-containing protein [Methanoregula sp.]|nr:FHA domain-containing protein [Methanoregula sp.]